MKTWLLVSKEISFTRRPRQLWQIKPESRAWQLEIDVTDWHGLSVRSMSSFRNGVGWWMSPAGWNLAFARKIFKTEVK